MPPESSRRKKKDFVVSEAYPESEYNPSGDILDGEGRISIEDLLDPLHGKSGFSKLRKSINRMEKKTATTPAPLPKTDQDRLERKVAYEHSKKDITKWEPLVKRNREAPTLFFDENVDLGFSTIGAIASEFKPRTDFEKKIASLVNENEFVEAHNRDGARLLELNKISVEEVKDRHERLPKMRSLLFRHELKAKARDKTLKVLEGDEELPKSGVLSLPFMVRGLKKRREAADVEAKLALEEYESSLNQLGDKSAPEISEKGASSGRMVFGVPKKVAKEMRKIEKLDNYYGNSDSENDVEPEEDNVIKHNNQNDKSLREADIDLNVLQEEFDIGHEEEFDIGHDSVFKVIIFLFFSPKIH